jgi:hypothetical protein
MKGELPAELNDAFSINDNCATPRIVTSDLPIPFCKVTVTFSPATVKPYVGYSVRLTDSNGLKVNAAIDGLGIELPPFGLDPWTVPYNSAPFATGAPAQLSQTGLFSDLYTLTPVLGLVEYSVNSALWTDGAGKRRWIALPGLPGQNKITFSPGGAWVFPEGTVLVKQFDLENVHVETRVMIKRNIQESGGREWDAYTYKWRQIQQTPVPNVTSLTEGGTSTSLDADLVDAAGASATYVVGGRNRTWNFPSQNQCHFCHNQPAGFVLGVRTGQMNGSHTYRSVQPNRDPATIIDNQLRAWNHLSLFNRDIGRPRNYVAYPTPSHANQLIQGRARSYLAANCSHCHQPGRQVMDFRYEYPDGQLVANELMDAININGRIVPGSTSTSSVYNRMASGSMPFFGASVRDESGLELIGNWITQLSQIPTLN